VEPLPGDCPFSATCRAIVLVSAALAVLSGCTAEREVPSATDVETSDGPGRLVIVGGSLDRDNADVYRAVVDAREGDGPFCVLPTASGVPEESMASAVEAFEQYGASPVDGIFVTTENPEAASDSLVVERIRACSGYWFTGGVQSRVIEVFRPDGVATPGYEALMERFEAGAVVGGSSAGAAMMPPRVIAGGSSDEALQNGVVSSGDEDGVIVEVGMGYFDHAVVDQHFLARGRIGRLLVATLAGVGGGIGLGIDENTGVVVDGSDAAVVGESGAILVDARGAEREGLGHGGRGIVLHLVGTGDAIDLETLEVFPASDKTEVETSSSAVEPPEDPFERWAFLQVLSDLAASEASTVEMAGAGHTITVEKGEGFRALSYGTEGVEGTPAGLSVGPLVVSVVPNG